MKVINRYHTYYEIELEAETELEALLEVGQFVELNIDGDYKEFKITRKDGNRFYVNE